MIRWRLFLITCLFIIRTFDAFSEPDYIPPQKRFDALGQKEIYDPTNYTLFLSRSIDNSYGLGFAFPSHMPESFKTSYYIQINAGSLNFNSQADYTTEDYEWLRNNVAHHESTSPNSQDLAVNPTLQSFTSYSITIGFATHLFEKLSIFYGAGYGEYIKTYSMEVYEIGGSTAIKTLSLADTENGARSLALDLGLTYHMNPNWLFLIGANGVGQRLTGRLGFGYSF